MKSKERVKKAFHFNRPDKVPKYLIAPGTDMWPFFAYEPISFQPTDYPPHVWGGPSLYSTKLYHTSIYTWKDEHRNNLGLSKKWWDYEKDGQLLTIDEWGIIWKSGAVKRDKTMGHPFIGPFHESYDNLDDYHPPDVTEKSRYRFWNSSTKLIARDKYIYGCPTQAFLYDHSSFLRGFSNLMIDFKRNPHQVHKLIKIVSDVFYDQIQILKEVCPELDGIFVLDDLGTQKSPFIHPKLFRKFFFKPYKRIIDLTHDLGMDFLLHCCGNVKELFPLFIELGIDVMEFDQPNVTGVENYKKYAEQQKMAFWLSSDLQTTFIQWTPEDVTAEVKYFVKEIGNNYGGLAFSMYNDNRAVQAPKANIEAFRNAMDKYGKYNKQGKIEWLI
jgi:hypothetical protein